MKVITLLNEKGGVGKTTLAVHIASGLAIKGYRVLLIDSDPQANATSSLGLAKEPRIYDLLVRNGDWRTATIKVPGEVYGANQQFYLVPSNVESRNIATSIGDNLRFFKRVREIESIFDFVIVDTAPTPSLLHAAITAGTDYILLPTETEAASALEGVPSTIGHAENVREAAAQVNLAKARILGIVPNMVEAHTNSHAAILTYLGEQYGELLWPVVRKSVTVQEAALQRVTMYVYDPRHTVTRDFWSIVERVEKTHE